MAVAPERTSAEERESPPGGHDLILVDGHAHLRRCFDVGAFLERGYANLRSAARKLGHGGGFVGVLCLTATRRDRGFSRLLEALDRRGAADDGDLRKWAACDTREGASLCLASGDGGRLAVVAGRQLASREKLEALAVGTRRQFGEGRPLAALIREVAEAGALPVVPWGAGKWTGARGRLVKRLLQDPDLPPFFLGDSANRPAVWPRPSHFRMAEELGVKNLPGSDPLPFPGEVRRVGSFGCALEGSLDLREPARDLRGKLLEPGTEIRPFGSGETLLRFLRNQAMMQLRNLTGKHSW